jgi:tetratricopeptide (TPR) repeat protein
MRHVPRLLNSARALFILTACAFVVAGCGRNPEARKQRFLESGNQYFAKGQIGEAVIEFRNAVQIDGRFGQARLRLAESYERLGNRQQALEEFVRAADLLPDDPDVQVAAGNYLLAARRFDEAKMRAEAALAKNANNATAQVLLGNALAGQKDFDGAVTEFEEAIRLDPTRAATYTNLGILESSRGRPAAAEQAFQRAVSLDPKSLPARLALANHYWASGRVADAESSLQQAIKLDPSSEIANRALVVFLIASGRTAEAEPFVRTLRKGGSLPFALADFYLVQNRLGDAISELESLRSHDELSSSAGRRLAQAYVLRGDFTSAERVTKELLGRDAHDSDALLLQAELLTRQGKRDEALEQIRSAVRVNASSIRAQFALGQALVARGETDLARQAFNEVLRLNPRATQAQVAISQIDLRGGRITESVQAAREAVRSEPDSLDAQLALVRGLVASREFDGAEKGLTPLLEKHPSSAALLVQRGLIAVGRKNITRARETFEQALRAEPGSAAALGGLVSLDIAAGKADTAMARVRAHLRTQPRTPEMLVVAARTAASARDLPAAEQYLRDAVQTDPNLLAGYVMLAQVYFAERRLNEARVEFEAVAAKQEKPVAAATMLGIIAQMQGDVALARRRFQQAIDLAPRAAVASNNLAWIYAEEGTNLDIALQLAQSAVQVAPRLPQVHDTLGWIYFKKQMPDRAVASFRESVKLAPESAIYQYHLGLALHGTGDVAQARQFLRRALTLPGDFSELDEAKRLLAELDSAPAAK